MTKQARLLLVLTMLVILIFPLSLLPNGFPVGCIPISRAGYIIKHPGKYCFTKDIHTRLDFADHRAEPAIIEIMSSDVTIDMLGHRAGRGKIFIQSGGSGIRISNAGLQGSRFTNITIKNGVLSDFNKGIYFYEDVPGFISGQRQVDNIDRNTFVYKPSNVNVINIIFKRCKENFYVWDAPS